VSLPPFGSDNYAATHPEVLAAIADANDGYAVAYGDDPWTTRLDEVVQELFGTGATAFPVLNGTGANVIGLMATAPRWAGVVASDVAHAHTDENGAPERVGGLKLLTRPVTDGRLTVADVEAWAGDLGDVHSAQPAVLTLTQATELGTVYRVAELRALTEAAHALGMAVHVDGSRLANAAAFLDVDLRALTTDVGVDLVSLGAAKNGGLIGEAVVVTSPADAPTPAAAAARQAAAQAIPYLRKSTMQLASKQRYLSAQLVAMFAEPAAAGGPDASAGTSTDRVTGMSRGMSSGTVAGTSGDATTGTPAGRVTGTVTAADTAADTSAVAGTPAGTVPGTGTGTTTEPGPGARTPRPLWWRNAAAANAAAQRLRSGVEAISGKAVGGKGIGGGLVRATRPTEANAVFATLPRAAADRLRNRTRFYDWADGETADRVEVRWMCSWATTAADVDAFLDALADSL